MIFCCSAGCLSGVMHKYRTYLIRSLIIFSSILGFEVLKLTEAKYVGSTAVTLVAVALNAVLLIPIVLQLIFYFALMDEQAYLLQHKILIIS